MPQLTSAGWVTEGYRVQYRGRYNKWCNLGLYGDIASAQHFIDKCTNGPAEKYRIVKEAV